MSLSSRLLSLQSVSRLAISRVVARSSVRSLVCSTVLRSNQMSVKQCGQIRTFAATVRAYEESPTAQLIKGLNDEIKHEESEERLEAPVEALKDIGYTLVDPEGKDYVELIKEVGDTKIKIVFTPSDVNPGETGPGYDPNEFDFGEEEEDFEADETPQKSSSSKDTSASKSKGASSKGKNKQVDESDIADEEEYEDEEDFEEPYQEPAIRTSILISRPSKGSLVFDGVIEGSIFSTDNAYVSPIESLDIDAINKNATDGKLYNGPPFSTLDLDLQDAIERYFEQFSINEELYQFIVEYSAYKENNEYVRWLQNVRNFLK